MMWIQAVCPALSCTPRPNACSLSTLPAISAARRLGIQKSGCLTNMFRIQTFRSWCTTSRCWARRTVMPNKFLLVLLPLAILSLPVMAKETAADNYKTYCMQCHGMDGNGKGVNIRDMSVQPRDHTDAKAMSTRSDDTLFKTIKEGGLSIDKSVLMPPWGDTLSDEEIKDMVQHLRLLCKCKFGS